MAAAPAAAPAPASAGRRWLFGPLPDLLLGCGVAYMLVFALLCFAGPSLRGVQPATLIPFLLIILTGVPHYGATLVRVYEKSEDRRAYVFFTVYLTIAVWLAFAIGVNWIAFGSLVLTVYLTWSPWHYTGQNYGLAVMFLRRRGIAFDERTKKLLHASFVLSFFLTFLTMHGNGPTTTYAPVSYAGTVYRFLPLGLPYPVRVGGLAICATGYAFVTITAFARLLRSARPGDLVPTALLVASQALWFAVPVLVREWGVPGLSHLEPFAVDQAAYAFLWIAAAHSVQYLWVTTFYAGMAGLPSGKLAYLGKTMLAGAAIWTVPPLLFAPGLLGRIPFDSGLALLGAAVVNLHHFLLDGAIWKLRDGRVARILIRPATNGDAAEAIAAPRRRWLAPVMWTAGAASVAIIFGAYWTQNVELASAATSGDVARAEQAARRLAWIRRDGPQVYLTLGRMKAQASDVAGAREAYLRSVAAAPTPEAYLGLGALDEHEGRWSEAAARYDEALGLDPNHVPALYRSGLAWLKLGDRARARTVLAKAAALAPDDKLLKLSLARAEAEGG